MLRVASRGDTVAVAYEDPNSERGRIAHEHVARPAGHLFEQTARLIPVSTSSQHASAPQIVRLSGSQLWVGWTEVVAVGQRIPPASRAVSSPGNLHHSIPMPRLIGAHTIDTGGIAMAARRAGNAGMTALQIFSAVPKFYNEKVSVKPERIRRFTPRLTDAGIARDAVIVHAGYVLNCATPEAEKWERAATALAKELERSTALGVRGVCFHPGAATDQDRAGGVARVATAMTRALESVRRRDEAAGREQCRRRQHHRSHRRGSGRHSGRVAAVTSAARAGYGLDTCHLFASGYDISASPEACRSGARCLRAGVRRAAVISAPE